MKKDRLKKMTSNELAELYIEKEEFLFSILEDIESGVAMKGTFEYRSLTQEKNELESGIFQINKEIQSRTA